MKYKITAPTTLKASVKLPASKSISNRALILNALSYSPYEIDGDALPDRFPVQDCGRMDHHRDGADAEPPD